MKKAKKNLIPKDAPYEVKRSTGAGLGLFATEPIAEDDFIIEYFGPYLTDAQVDDKGGRYMFSLGDGFNIDGSGRDNIARYVNHSCDPNAHVWQYAKRIRIKASRDIEPGEEIAYDYGKDYFDEFIGKNCTCVKHTKK